MLAGANAELRQQLGAGQTALRTKEGELSVSWYSHGGVQDDICHKVASCEGKTLPEYPGTGMRVARASLPRFGALRRDNTPTPACLSISGISGTECS